MAGTGPVLDRVGINEGNRPRVEQGKAEGCIEQLDRLLRRCVKLGASDMHLSSNKPVSYRVDGKLRVFGETVYAAEAVAAMAESLMSEAQRREFAVHRTADLGHSSSEGERYRINCYFEMNKPAMAVRHLDQNILGLEELGLPLRLRELAYLKSGLVLVTGATGSGKSSTLAVLLDEINRNRECHILTVEDPVEFVHQSRKSLVHHREVHRDVPSYAEAVRAAMREDPDVIMVGEMRDQETMQASIIAAETGHLVFSTLHTGEAIGAIERFIGYFSGEEQGVARHRISMVLKAVIAQRLVPALDCKGRVPAVELLMVTTAAANLIQNSKTRQLYSMMESGARDGMWTLDQELARLVKNGKVAQEVALDLCNDKDGFKKHLTVAGGERR
jgi:twitching motility protein PilT